MFCSQIAFGTLSLARKASVLALVSSAKSHADSETCRRTCCLAQALSFGSNVLPLRGSLMPKFEDDRQIPSTCKDKNLASQILRELYNFLSKGDTSCRWQVIGNLGPQWCRGFSRVPKLRCNCSLFCHTHASTS